jgi:hypothetical protein
MRKAVITPTLTLPHPEAGKPLGGGDSLCLRDWTHPDRCIRSVPLLPPPLVGEDERWGAK